MKWSHIIVAVLIIALVTMLLRNSSPVSGMLKWLGNTGSSLTKSVSMAG